jgi:hypothetical protein
MLLSGMIFKHCTAIMQESEASRRHQAWNPQHCAASHRAWYPSIAPPSGAISKHCAASNRAQNPSIAPQAIGRNIQVLRCQLSGTKSKLRAASHWGWHQGITLPSGAKLRHCAAIRRNIEVSHPHLVQNWSITPILGAELKHRATSHRVQHQGIAPPSGAKLRHCAANRHNIEALRCHPVQNWSIAPLLGAKLKHPTTSHRPQYPSIAPAAIGCDIQALHHHQARYPSIVPPAIERKIQALCRRPSGTIYKHLAAIWCSIVALHCHWALNGIIALPAIGKPKHCAAIGCKIKASHRLIDVAGKPASRIFLHLGIAVARVLP